MVPFGTRPLLLGALAVLTACSTVPTSPPHEDTRSAARWGLDPATLPDANDRSISVGVWEVACSGGRDIRDKILPPEITYEPGRVIVTLWLEPLPVLEPNEVLTCEGVAPVPYTVNLSEAPGDRVLVDGNQAVGGEAMTGDVIDPGLLGRWQLVDAALDGHTFAPLTEGAITLVVHGEGIGGNGGCNAYSTAPIRVTADAIAIPLPSSHLASCPDGRSAVETLFLRSLPRVSAWRLVTGRLELAGTGAFLTFRRPPPTDCERDTSCSQVWVRVIGTDSADRLPSAYELWLGTRAYRVPPDAGSGVAAADAPSPIHVRLLDANTCASLADFPADPGTYFVIRIDDAANVQVEDLTGSGIELGPGLTESSEPAC
jgi:hypothetical protein